jgi:hypothetical protein
MTALPQHMVALAEANRIRLARGGIKHQIAHGERTAASVILEPPPETLTMTVYDLLCAQHRGGRERARRLLITAGVREGKLLGDLTNRQRRILTDLLAWGTTTDKAA